MAYETGTATSASDLLSKIRTFALAHNWAVAAWNAIANDNPSGGFGPGQWLCLNSVAHPGTYYGMFAADNPHSNTAYPPTIIYGIISTDFTGGSSEDQWFNQSGKADLQSGMFMDDMAGPYASYHIFGEDGEYIHVVIETSPDIYSFLCIGNLSKFGTYTGGGYMSMTAWHHGTTTTNYPDSTQHTYLFDVGSPGGVSTSMIVRCEYDAKAWVHTGSNDTSYPQRQIMTTGRFPLTSSSTGLDPIWTPGAVDFLVSPNEFNQITPYHPIPIYVERGSGLYSPIGEVKDVRVLNMTNYQPKDIETFGADNWMIFPGKQKTLTKDIFESTIPSSYKYGYAFKKVV